METILARGWSTALGEMVMRCVPVRTAESAMMQVGAREVGAFGREELGRGRVVDIFSGMEVRVLVSLFSLNADL